VEATTATVREKLMAGYRSSFRVTKIPMAITATATSIQSWLDEKPKTVASRTSQSDIGVPSKREVTIARLHRPYMFRRERKIPRIGRRGKPLDVELNPNWHTRRPNGKTRRKAGLIANINFKCNADN
jgi:hypothetical protein